MPQNLLIVPISQFLKNRETRNLKKFYIQPLVDAPIAASTVYFI